MKVEDSGAGLQSRADSAPMLVAVGIEKAFDRTRALARAELDVYPCEVMGLLGANGAGKSTLSKVISGHVVRDAGSITFRGRPLTLRTAREAIQHGITMVMQETSLAPDLSVLENISRGTWSARIALVPQIKAAGGRNSRPVGQTETLPLDREVRLLSTQPNGNWSNRQSAGTEFHLDHFDEPTASLILRR
jgi:ribose transport system ATP-binding protein/rhamnose transport system ATP-binding protein